VDHSGLPRGGQSQHTLTHEPQGFPPLHGSKAADTLLQVFTFQVLHAEVGTSLLLAGVNHLDHVGMAQPKQHARFTDKTRAVLRVTFQLIAHHFQCNQAAAGQRVLGKKNAGHAASAQETAHVITPKPELTGRDTGWLTKGKLGHALRSPVRLAAFRPDQPHSC